MNTRACELARSSALLGDTWLSVDELEHGGQFGRDSKSVVVAQRAASEQVRR